MGTIIKFPDKLGGYRRPPSIYIGVDYDEKKPETYRGCFVEFDNGSWCQRLMFETYGAAMAHASGLGIETHDLPSVDEFCADVDALRGEE